MVALLQTTKSREAYEAQQLTFLQRPFSSSAPHRSRPQSAGSAGWSGGRDRGGSSKSGAKENGFPNPPSCPPPVYHRSSSRPVGGGGGRGKGASFDLPPPAFGRGSDTTTAAIAAAAASATASASGGGTRLGKTRTRVRPSSANARVYGRPGAGKGVGGSGGGGQPPASGAASVPRKVHIPRHTTGYGAGTPAGDGGNVTTGSSRGQASVSRILRTIGVCGVRNSFSACAVLFGFWLQLQRYRPFKGEEKKTRRSYVAGFSDLSVSTKLPISACRTPCRSCSGAGVEEGLDCLQRAPPNTTI